MKRVFNFIAVCICLVCCVSCENKNGIMVSTPSNTADILNHITKVEIEGHTYLVYIDYNYNQGYAGLCHDENCHCKTDSIK